MDNLTRLREERERASAHREDARKLHDEAWERRQQKLRTLKSMRAWVRRAPLHDLQRAKDICANAQLAFDEAKAHHEETRVILRYAKDALAGLISDERREAAKCAEVPREYQDAGNFKVTHRTNADEGVVYNIFFGGIDNSIVTPGDGHAHYVIKYEDDAPVVWRREPELLEGQQ